MLCEVTNCAGHVLAIPDLISCDGVTRRRGAISCTECSQALFKGRYRLLEITLSLSSVLCLKVVLIVIISYDSCPPLVCYGAWYLYFFIVLSPQVCPCVITCKSFLPYSIYQDLPAITTTMSVFWDGEA